MNQQLSKRLMLTSLVAAALGGILMGHSVTANAKAPEKIVSQTALKLKASKRNVEPNGKAGLYTKPSALKGERVVLSKKTMKKMDRSEDADHYLRAYRVARTNHRKVYYKVVTFDGKHRGWVYGGTKVNRFGGGLHEAKTYHELTRTSAEATKTYQFANPGTTHVTWQAPVGTTYKPSKVITTTTPYASDDLHVKSVVEREKGDKVYYYVASVQHPAINGWIYSGAVTPKTGDDGVSQQPESETATPGQPDPVTPSPETPGTPGGSINYSGKFSHTDAQVYRTGMTQETDKGIVSKVQKAYKNNVIKDLVEPFQYDQSMALATVSQKLGHGKRFTAEGGRNYVVVVSPTASSIVKLVPYTQVKWLNPKAAVSGLDGGILGMLVNEELKKQIQTAANLYYKLNYLGSLVIMSPMSDETVKSLLGDGKQLSINVEQFIEELPLTIKFDISVTTTRDDNGLTDVKVELKLDPKSLEVPEPANPAACHLDVDMTNSGYSGWKATLAKLAVKVFYPTRYPYFDKIDKGMDPAKIKRVLGNGRTTYVDQANVKANLTPVVEVVQKGNQVESVSVNVVVTKPAE